jgi:hypothetical protein
VLFFKARERLSIYTFSQATIPVYNFLPENGESFLLASSIVRFEIFEILTK